MKTNYKLFNTVVVTLLFTAASFAQATLAQWNFNGADANSIPGGPTAPNATSGSGSVAVVGGLTPSFAAGVNNSGIGSSDPVTTSPPNFALATTNYAASGTGNKQSGIQVNVSTAGYSDITFRFDQRLSNKANNTWVVQYTADRTVATPVWVDAQTFTFTPAETGTGDVWYNLRTVNLTAVTALNNNPNIAFRVVAAFDPSAGNYTASTSTSTYDPTGVVRFDMVTVSAATTLGVPTFNAENSFAVYPNPSNKEIVHFNEAHDIEVYDVTGKVVLKALNVSSIDTKSFNSGVYFIRTETGLSKKLIVK
jgi:hypothetical protein